MPQGPAGGPRPFAKTNLKYDVQVEVDEGVWLQPPKAIDLIDMRVNAPQQDSNQFIKKKVGKVILAANGLAHPSRVKNVAEEIETYEPGGVIDEGNVRVTWTYIVQGSGVGAFNDTATTSESVWKLHEVLVKENDSPISRSSVQREWNPSPYSVERIVISTD